MRRWISRAITSCLFLGMIAPAAAADDATVKAAQTLFDSALELMKKGQFEQACPRFGEAARLVPNGLGIKEQQALCHEKQGLLATAYSEWTALERLATAAKQEERAKLSASHAAALSSRVSTLMIQLAPSNSAPPGMEVKRDGVAVSAAEIGSQVPVEGGSHEITVSAPGYVPFSKSVQVAPEGARVVIEVPALVPVAGPAATPTASVTAPSPAISAAPSAPPDIGSPTWQRPLGIAAIAVGAASIVTGGVLGGLAIAKKDESNKGPCSANNLCTQEGVDLRDQALSLGSGSTAAIVAGGVLSAAGVTLLILSPSTGSQSGNSASARASGRDLPRGPGVQVRASPAGLSVTGRF